MLRRGLCLSTKVPIRVAELRCMDPGCPGLETVAVVLLGEGRRRRFRWNLPLEQVGVAEVNQLLDGGGGGGA